MRCIPFLPGLAALTLIGCHSEGPRSADFASLPPAFAKQSSQDKNANANPARRAWVAKIERAETLSRTPATYAEAETVLKELIAERPRNGMPYRLLGHLYQAQGDMQKSLDAFDTFIAMKGGPQDGDWYAIYLAAKATGKETEARGAVKSILADQRFDPSVTYSDTSRAPSATVLALMEAEVANSMLGYREHEKGIAMLDAAAKKEGLTPEMMWGFSSKLRAWVKKDTATQLLWKVYRSDSELSKRQSQILFNWDL